MSLNEEVFQSGASRHRWIILALAWIVFFVFGMIISSIPPLVSPIANELSLNNTQMGVILGSIILMYIPLSVPIGILVDKIGLKRLITTGIIFLASSSVLRSFAFNFETLFLAVSLFGFGGPMISVGLAKVIASTFSGKERGLASGIYFTGVMIGSATALALTNTLIIPAVGTWRNVFILFGIIGFLTAFIWMVLGNVHENTPEKEKSDTQLKSIVRLLVRNKYVWLIALVGTSYFFAAYGLGTWLPTLLESKGMTPGDAGLFASIPNWIGIAGSAIIPSLGKAGSRKSIVFALILLQGISVFFIGTTFGLPLILALGLFGFTTFAIVPILLVILMDLPKVGSEYIGIASGIFFSLGAVIGFLAPLIVGYIADLTGSLVPSVMLIAIVVEVTLVSTFFLKEK